MQSHLQGNWGGKLILIAALCLTSRCQTTHGGFRSKFLLPTVEYYVISYTQTWSGCSSLPENKVFVSQLCGSLQANSTLRKIQAHDNFRCSRFRLKVTVEVARRNGNQDRVEGDNTEHRSKIKVQKRKNGRPLSEHLKENKKITQWKFGGKKSRMM